MSHVFQYRVPFIIAATVFVGGSWLAAIGGLHLWPFLDYRMYSGIVADPTVEIFYFEGEATSGAKITFDQWEQTDPFTSKDLHYALADAFYSKSDLTPLTRSFFKRYQLRKVEPHIQALHLIHVMWDGSSVKKFHFEPTMRTVLKTVHASELDQ